MVWRYFLRVIGIEANTEQAIIALTGGDAAGIYLQDLLVSQDLETSVSKPLAVTTLMIWMELTLSMITLAIVGLPAVVWFQWVTLCCGIGSVLIRLGDRATSWWGQIGQKLLDGLKNFIGTCEPLSEPRVLAIGLSLTGVYMFIAVLAFWLVNAGLRVPHIDLAASVAVYSLIMLITNGNSLPTDLGVSELSGIGGFLAFGVDRSTGLAAMLTFHMASVLFAELIAAAVFFAFRDEVKKILRRIGIHAKENGASDKKQPARHEHAGTPPGDWMDGAQPSPALRGGKEVTDEHKRSASEPERACPPQ